MEETKVGEAFSLAKRKPWRNQTMRAIFRNREAFKQAYLDESTYRSDHLRMHNFFRRRLGQKVPLVLLLLLIGQDHTRLRPVNLLEL